ncbi:Protein of uncharacterised function (DUF2612) [Haemophilus parainfluenzae]|uniref:Protein of uncharacterized function (DUF2612) n=1 Tax=Haemophilus parainfluenzae TaxID=729 RepID=A0A377JKT6_HAEPA|nr:Protein of uncharacterised function (DUF2612) [Haemophilus parainfluenzae]
MGYSDLLIWQYRNKPKAVSTIKLFENIIGQGFIDLYRLQDVLNIETATGISLIWSVNTSGNFGLLMAINCVSFSVSAIRLMHWI